MPPESSRSKTSQPDLVFKALFNQMPYSVRTQRFVIDSAASLLPLPWGTRRKPVCISGIPAYWIKGWEDGSGRLIYYLHGGGYVTGSIRTHRALAGFLCKSARARALLLEYRLAPENPFPAALQDALLVYRRLLEAGADPGKIGFAGDSAGGGLCLSLMMELRDQGLPLPAAAYLMSPWTDLTKSNRPYRLLNRYRKNVVDWGADAMASMYHGSMDPSHPRVSPLFGDFRGLPPLFVSAGRWEPLRHDARSMVKKAREAGVEVVFEHYRNPVHVFQALAPVHAPARRLLERGGRFLRERVS